MLFVQLTAASERDGIHTTKLSWAYQEAVEFRAVNLNKKLDVLSDSNKNVDLVGPGIGILSTYVKK